MPAPENRLKAALAAGREQFGFWISLADPYAAELPSRAGFDWLLLDGEHAPNDIRALAGQLQTLEASESNVVVRAPIGETWIIKRLLDIGAQSLLIPMVESAAQAEGLVRATRYPPHGVRGVGAAGARASHFSGIADYVTTADAQICLIAQLESRAGLDNLDAILAVEGLDAVFIGPADLAASLGHLDNPAAPEVRAAIEDATARIVAAGKAAGVMTGDESLIARCRELGATMIGVGGDAALYARAAADLAARYRA